MGYIKMSPVAWGTLLRVVHTQIFNGYQARDYVLTNLYANQEELCGEYGSVPKIINRYVENMFSDVFWRQKQDKKTM
jgi:hypothetical protein